MARHPTIARFSSFEDMNKNADGQIMVKVPEEFSRRFRVFCAQMATGQRDVVMAALAEFLDKHKNLKTPPPIRKAKPLNELSPEERAERERKLREWMDTPNEPPAPPRPATVAVAVSAPSAPAEPFRFNFDDDDEVEDRGYPSSQEAVFNAVGASQAAPDGYEEDEETADDEEVEVSEADWEDEK